MLALPSAAYFLFLEAAVGGVIALFWLQSRHDLPRGFILFTSVCLLVTGGLATWLRLAGQIEAELARTPASRAKLGLHLASAARQMTVVDLHEQAALEQVEREQAIEAEGVDVDHA